MTDFQPPVVDGRIGGTCATCGQPGHRYGTTDTEHVPDPIGCVNSLLGRVEELEAQADAFVPVKVKPRKWRMTVVTDSESQADVWREERKRQENGEKSTWVEYGEVVEL